MFENVGQGRRDPDGKTAAQVAMAVLRSPFTIALGSLIAVLIMVAGLYVVVIYGRAVSESCDELPVTDMPIEDMIALKNRMDSYKRDPQPDAELELSVLELNFATRNKHYGFRSHAEILGNTLTLRATVPQDDGRCYNVRFQGQIAVADGVVTMAPDSLIVGEADVTWLAGLMGGITLTPEDMPDETSAEHLENLHSLRISQGLVLIEMRDRWLMF